MVQPQTITVEYVHNRQCEYNLKPDVNTVLFFYFFNFTVYKIRFN